MALKEKDRLALYQGLRPVVGEEAVEAMLSQFPATPADELVTRDHLRAELLATKADLQTEIGAVRTDLTAAIGAVRTDLTAAIGAVRTDLTAAIGAVHEAVGKEMRTWFVGAMTLMIGLFGLLGGVVTLLSR